MTSSPGGRAGDGTNESRCPNRVPAPDASDQQLARVLMCMWSLASGRRPRRNVQPDQLTEDELIAFWADEFRQPSGRHARPESSPVEAA